MAYAFWTHEEYQLDQGRLSRFVAAYQQVHAFTIGELWAVPTMLRLALLETLAQAAGRITRQATDTGVTGSSPAASDSPAVLNDNDVVANCILSLRRLNSQDWNRFFEGVSLVQQILSKDPAGIYARMDFASRDRYRGVVEMLAHATGQDETVVAQKAIDLTSVNDDGAAPAEGDGVIPPEASSRMPTTVNSNAPTTIALAAPSTWTSRTAPTSATTCSSRGARNWRSPSATGRAAWQGLRRGMVRHPTLVYLGGIGLLTGLIVAGFVAYARRGAAERCRGKSPQPCWR